MKSTRTRILTIGAAVLLTAAAALAQGWHHRGGFQHMLRQLDLTSEQQSQVKAIWAKEKPTLQPLMQQMRQNNAAMDALVSSGFDEGKATTLATQNSQTAIQLQVEHAKIKSEIMQILTADQKAKLAQLEARHASRGQRQAGQTSAPPTD
jgi:periplasmic protein CpxP/Spy